jgi:hypothetical protein
MVGSALRAMGACGAPAIERFLGELERLGIRGLPVGPEPSGVLANAVLRHADRALDAERVEQIRWVDDVVISASAPADARDALDVLRGALGEIGLRLNEGKTRVVDDPSALGTLSAVSGPPEDPSRARKVG